MLEPNPNDEQFETLREIALLSSITDAQFYVSGLTQAQWAATLEDLTEWAKVKNKHVQVKGGKFGVVINKNDNRLDIRNRVRGRFGLSQVDAEGRTPYSFEEDDCSGTTSVDVCGGW